MKKSIQIAVSLSNIGKKYEVHHEKPTLVEKFFKGKNEIFWALKNIDLTIYKGDKIGIIGPNGSGKTTLLKIISGITSPTIGTVFTQGRVVSLIDLEAGFHPDLSGIQNIYLHGAILGLSKKNIDEQLTHIISYAEIRQFIDAPLFTYSEGMKLRLGFSVALFSNPDILVLDEGLTVGDLYFQKKINKTLLKQMPKNNTIIIVSHNLDGIKTFTDKVILLKEGTIQCIGTSTNVIRSYTSSLRTR